MTIPETRDAGRRAVVTVAYLGMLAFGVVLTTLGSLLPSLDHLAARQMEPPGYEIYPANLWEPHRTARFQLGE